MFESIQVLESAKLENLLPENTVLDGVLRIEGFCVLERE
jgi:hypothetical protein